MPGQSSILVDPGTTTKLATWQRSDGTNTVEVYKQVLDEAFAPSYVISINTAVSTATANSHLLEIVAGSTFKVILHRILVTQLANASASTSAQCELFRLSSAGTGGTAFTPRPLDPADSAAGATAMTLPSAKGTEGVSVWAQAGILLATAATAGSDIVLDLDFRGLRHKGLVIAAGTSNGVALKNITAVASATVLISALITEVPYTL